MKAIRVDAVGGPDALCYVDLPVPQPGPDQALVRLAAIGINFIDTYHRAGLYPLPLPFVPGSEGAGTIAALGAGVRDLDVGDRVAYAMVPGAYAEYAAVPAGKLVRIPAGVSYEDAAALMLQGMTAQYLTTSTFPLARGDTTLVHAGAGGVGLLLTQRAKTLGATVITTVSSQEKAALSRDAGADHVIRYDAQDVATEVRRLTGGRGVDVVYDGVGKTTFEGSLDALRPRGMLALFGASSGPVPPFDLARLAQKGSLFVTRPTLGDYVATPDELRRRATDVFDAIASGELRLRVEHVYPLENATLAHADLEGRRTTGKLLLIPPNETTT
jgi:NADPH2:quinone reductase